MSYSERITVTGTVGFTCGNKMQIKGGGRSFYGSIPHRMGTPSKGDIVTVTVRVASTVGQCSYFKNPTKGSILEKETNV